MTAVELAKTLDMPREQWLELEDNEKMYWAVYSRIS